MEAIHNLNIMSSSNRRILGATTINHEGVVVESTKTENQLTRLVLACLLFEKQFYIDGIKHADQVKALVTQCDPQFVAKLAIKARSQYKLRHIPLFLARELARTGNLSADTLFQIIQRADEMGEFLAMYWKEGKTPISNQVKKGLAKAFLKFNEYNLAKFDKNSAAVSVRDVMFLSHAKPTTPEQEELFKRVANQTLAIPLTWETQLSAGADKKETFSRLMTEKKLGALAFLRNLRNMVQAGVDEDAIRAYGNTVDVSKVLPFRFVAAARIVPQFEDMLEKMMFRSLATMEKLPGKTVLLVDVSGSMFGCPISAKSDLDRFDAAAALAMLCKEVCEEVEIYSFSTNLARVTPRSGFALREAISKSQHHGGTNLGSSLRQLTSKHDRIVILTDEQSYDRPTKPNCPNAYIINVAAYENGVNHSDYTTISGFSEAVIDYIRESEKTQER